MVEQSEGLDRSEALNKHLEAFPVYRVPRTNFDEALHAVTAVPTRLARDGRRAKMKAVFDGQATWGQIKHWRAGRRTVPQWARDMLARKLAEQRTRADRGIESLQRSA